MSNRLPFSNLAAEPCCLLLALCLLSGCAQPPDAVLRFGLSSAPATLDPRLATDAAAARLCRLLYATPVDFDSAFRPQPAIMHWQMLAPDHYVFRLRREARFHDGSPISAEDVAATYRSVLDPALASPHRGALAHIASIEATNRATLEIRLTRPDPLFPGLLTLGVLPARELESASKPPAFTGSGGFRLAAPFNPQKIQLQRLEDGQRVDFVVVPNETTRALKLARGELDLVQGGISPELTAWLSHEPGVSVRRVRGTVYTYLGFNLAEGPTRDPRVRRAIAHAVDREALVRHVFKSRARLAEGVLVPEHWAGVATPAPLRYDPAQSRQLLAMLGHGPAHPLELTYKTSNDFFRRRLATILQDQLAAVGIRLIIRSHDWGTFFGDIRRGDFELYALSWVGLQLPDIFRQAFHSTSVPPAGANRGRYASAEADALIEEAELAPDEASRAAGYRAVQSLLARDLPYVSLWFEDVVVVQGARVVGYDTDPNGHYDGLLNTRLALDATPTAQH